MRCPYCGGLNQERAVFCVNCGRDLRRAQQNAQPQRPQTQTQQPVYPPNQPTRGAHQQAQAQQAQTANRRQPAVASRASVPTAPAPTPVVPLPEPPGPFPPRTLAQFVALLATGSQAYTVIGSEVENGKKIVSIIYARCANWQQAATLLKALQEQQEDKYTTVVIRGILAQRQDTYGFTNGQLQFDRGVRLGARICNRYTLETGNGYSADSLRFVLNE